jgi:tetratricopeptide (TPR) repeat protein
VQATLDKHPHDVDALIALSTIQWSYTQLDASVRSAEQGVAAAEGSAAAHAQLVNALGAKLASSRIGTMEKVSVARRFHRESERTLQLDPNNVYALEAMARFCWYAPAFGGRDRSKSLRLVEQLIRLDAARGYALKAELDASDAGGTKCPASVQSDWRQAVAAKPESYDSHTGLASCLLSSGGDKSALAESEARRALALTPARIAAHRLLAIVHVITGRWSDLDAELKRARAVVPDDLSAEYAAAEAILDHNAATQLPRAESYLRHYLSQPAEGLAPSWAMAHWKLALVFEKEGHKADAVQELKAAVQLDSSLDEARKELKRLQ